MFFSSCQERGTKKEFWVPMRNWTSDLRIPREKYRKYPRASSRMTIHPMLLEELQQIIVSLSKYFFNQPQDKTRKKSCHCELIIASLWLGWRSLRTFATGTYRRPITSLKVLIPHSNILWPIKTSNHEDFNQIPKTLFFGYLNFGLLLEENIADNGIS